MSKRTPIHVQKLNKTTIHISLSLDPNKEKELIEEQKKRLRQGYPKVGKVITAIKSRKAYLSYSDEYGRIDKGKRYTVIDNADLMHGYYHIKNEDEAVCILLTTNILKEFFGIKLKMNPSVR